MDARSTGLIVVVVGVLVILVGLVMMTGALNWVGRLPGDIRFESGNTRIYIPITTMIIVSIFLSLILFLARRLF
jgi:cytochrome b subunit of formate dehydrogenase